MNCSLGKGSTSGSCLTFSSSSLSILAFSESFRLSASCCEYWPSIRDDTTADGLDRAKAGVDVEMGRRATRHGMRTISRRLDALAKHFAHVLRIMIFAGPFVDVCDTQECGLIGLRAEISSGEPPPAARRFGPSKAVTGAARVIIARPISSSTPAFYMASSTPSAA